MVQLREQWERPYKENNQAYQLRRWLPAHSFLWWCRSYLFYSSKRRWLDLVLKCLLRQESSDWSGDQRDEGHFNLAHFLPWEWQASWPCKENDLDWAHAYDRVSNHVPLEARPYEQAASSEAFGRWWWAGTHFQLRKHSLHHVLGPRSLLSWKSYCFLGQRIRRRWALDFNHESR